MKNGWVYLSSRFQVKARLQKMGALQPLNIFLRQEIDRMQRVITAVRNTLTDLQLAIEGTIIMSEVWRLISTFWVNRVIFLSRWYSCTLPWFIYLQLLVLSIINLQMTVTTKLVKILRKLTVNGRSFDFS